MTTKAEPTAIHGRSKQNTWERTSSCRTHTPRQSIPPKRKSRGADGSIFLAQDSLSRHPKAENASNNQPNKINTCNTNLILTDVEVLCWRNQTRGWLFDLGTYT